MHRIFSFAGGCNNHCSVVSPRRQADAFLVCPVEKEHENKNNSHYSTMVTHHDSIEPRSVEMESS